MAATDTLNHNKLHVEFIGLPHGYSQNYPIHNVGHIIHLGGYTVLHVGDPEMDAGQFAQYALPERFTSISPK